MAVSIPFHSSKLLADCFDRDVITMVCAAMAELIIQSKAIWLAFKSLFQGAYVGINTLAQRRAKSISFFAKHSVTEHSEILVEDPARPEDQVKDWMWLLGLLVTVVVAMIIGQIQ